MSKPDLDRVEKSIELRAPRSRVWRAISNAKEFGTWFGLGDPMELVGDFVPGARIEGTWTVDGKEVRETFCTIETVEPERLLAFRWVPYELPPGEDPSKHPTTRIEMRLEETATGTRLVISESGFASLPADKQYKRQQNADGWAVQAKAIARHVLGKIDVRVQYRIARPLADVFEAIVDPAKMAGYFISASSGRMAPNAQLVWEWSEVGAKADVYVHQVEAPRRVVFLWSAAGAGDPSKVTLSLEPDGEAATKLVCVETPFALTEEDALRALGQTQGWTDFCCSLRGYLEHGIDLRRGKRADGS